MSLYDPAVCDRAVLKLMKKQFPGDEFVLEDDIIVLTEVDIRSTNIPGDTDESDEDSDDELAQFHRADAESDLESQMSVGDDDDLDDFIDDRPESELSWHSESEDDERGGGVEDREYDSENDGNQTDRSESDIDNNKSHDINEDENENENEIDENKIENKNGNGNGNGNEHGTDSDEDVKPSLSKRPKMNTIPDDSSSELSDSDEETGHSSDHSEESSPSNSGTLLQQFTGNDHHSNKFNVLLLPKINRKSTCLRYHGRIGMQGIKGICRRMTKKKFCDLIEKKRTTYGFTRLNLMYANARHLEYKKPESKLQKPVRRLLIHLIDQWFPLGIPQTRHLDRAKCLLECIKKRIQVKKVPNLKHSNKFYALIPHQGDNRRRLRFKTTEQCENKIVYVDRMISAIECLTEADEQRRKNPLDYFIDKWLDVDLKVLTSNDAPYQTLKKVVENTQHPDLPRPYRVANIFQVNNMNGETNGDFSTQITQNHRYLFHFTFASNLLNILREGLIPSPKHIHSASRFLGNGIYFWDSISNASLKYNSLNTVYILVCRVALGNARQVEQTSHLLDGEDSIFSAGREFNSTRDEEEELNGSMGPAKIYCGQMKNQIVNNSFDPYSLYNRYVVPNKNQVIVEYLLKLKRD